MYTHTYRHIHSRTLVGTHTFKRNNALHKCTYMGTQYTNTCRHALVYVYTHTHTQRVDLVSGNNVHLLCLCCVYGSCASLLLVAPVSVIFLSLPKSVCLFLHTLPLLLLPSTLLLSLFSVIITGYLLSLSISVMEFLFFFFFCQWNAF